MLRRLLVPFPGRCKDANDVVTNTGSSLCPCQRPRHTTDWQHIALTPAGVGLGTAWPGGEGADPLHSGCVLSLGT